MRIATVAMAVAVLSFPAPASERLSLTFDRNAGQLKGMPLSFLPQTEAFTMPEGIRPRPDVRYVSYPVFGKSFVEIMKSVEENSVQSPGRPRRSASSFDWITGLAFAYDYTYEIDEEENTAVVTMEVIEIRQRDGFRISLPHLVNDTALNPIELSLFREFLSKLIEQEHRRVEIVQDASVWGELKAGIERLQVFKVSLIEDMDLERTIESIVSKEAGRLALKRAERVRDKIREFDRTAASVGEPGKK